MISPWEMHSAEIISAVMEDRNIAEELAWRQGLQAEHLTADGIYRVVWKTILEILPEKGMPTTPDIIWTKNQNIIDLGALYQIKDSYSIGKDHALQSCSEVKRISKRHRQLEAVTKAQVALTRGDDSDPIITQLVRQLSASDTEVIQSTVIKDIVERINARIDAGEVQSIIPTHIPWLDAMMNGGLRPKRLIAIGGADKSRKTTLLRNIILNTLRNRTPSGWEFKQNISFALMAFENDQEITTFDFIAMLMFEYLREKGETDTYVGSVMAHELCDAETIERMYETYRKSKIHPLMAAAIEYALEHIEQMNISIYDSATANGGLDTIDDLIRVTNMHTTLFAGKEIVVAVDYAQLAEDTGDTYKDMKRFSKAMLNKATTQRVTVIALSQYNEEAKKARAQGIETGTVGTKGGGDLAQAVHNYFDVQYDSDNDDTRLKVTMPRARRGKGGKKSRQDFIIHPPSGYITGTRANSR